MYICPKATFSRYVLKVLAVDFGTPALTGTATLSIRVNDLNDNTPVIGGQPYDNSILEDSDVGSSVFDIDATDEDSGYNSDLMYTIASGDQGHFKINRDTGLLTTRASLDRETIDKYVMVVEVADQGLPALTATATATVTIVDVNDNAPSFTQTFTFYLSENVDNDTEVGRVFATDDDEGANAVLQYTIIQTRLGADDHFRIDPADGTIYTLTTWIDREAIDEYIVTVRAVDSGTPSLYTDTDVTIQIIDQNDNTPTCGEALYEVIVEENSREGENILQITATDNDLSDNGRLTYALSNTPNRTSEHFSIDSADGTITLTQALDREVDAVFEFEVWVRDNGVASLTSVCPVSVTVVDQNDHHPVFDKDFFNTEVPTDALENYIIAQVRATDADASPNNIMMYQLSKGSQIFEIDPYSGTDTNT